MSNEKDEEKFNEDQTPRIAYQYLPCRDHDIIG